MFQNIFLIQNSSFQENAKTKVYALEDSLGVDASTSGLGAVLYQEQTGIDRVIAYASMSLKPSENNTSPIN